ncbi:MAG: tRNA pseudouridine(38-40) synthase TruA [Acidobacteriota bacterium]
MAGARYKLTLSYVGTRYAGWQRQENALAVQQVVEEALSDLLGDPATLVGASRTDAGVHARGQVAHLEWVREVETGALLHGTNHRLPREVRVLAAEPADEAFHARFSATAKEYRYRLIRAAVLSPLDAPFAVKVEDELDLEALANAAQVLVGRHDFSSFALAGGAHTSPLRTVHSAQWVEEGAELQFRVVGDGFLRGMVRGLVGTLLEVGRGRRRVEDFQALLVGKPRGAAGPTAPAQGLCLTRVLY